MSIFNKFLLLVVIAAVVPVKLPRVWADDKVILLPAESIHIHELFTKKLIPELFNWTSHGISEQFRYRPTLRNHPGLISWMSYNYSPERHCGYLYGTPTEQYVNKRVEIEIVALNRQNYETRRVVIPFYVNNKTPPKNIIQMKLDNLNWVHMMDAGRVENLKNIFRNDLWPESKADLEVSFMESAIKMGGRLPLRPQQKEGVFVNLGSKAKFSDRLNDLHEEIKPLYKISSCSYKRTSVQYLFENAGFKLDWCAFKFITEEMMGRDADENMGHHQKERWIAPSKEHLPERNYSDEISISIAIPAVLFAFLVATLTVILCFHHEKIAEPKREPTVQMVQYSGNATTTTTLKSTVDATTYENMSLPSESPSNSLYRKEESPRTSSLRPKPPSYPKYGPSTSSTIQFENGNGHDSI